MPMTSEQSVRPAHALHYPRFTRVHEVGLSQSGTESTSATKRSLYIFVARGRLEKQHHLATRALPGIAALHTMRTISKNSLAFSYSAPEPCRPLFLPKAARRDYLAMRSFESWAPIVSKADMICVVELTMKKFELPLAQYCRMVEVGSPSVLTCMV